MLDLSFNRILLTINTLQKLFALFFCHCMLVIPFLQAQQAATLSLYFNHNEYSLTDSAKDLLLQKFQADNHLQIKRIALAGHTDSVGSSSYNQLLAQRRTSAVADFLIALGIPAAKIETAAFGKSSPIAQNNTEAGRQQNRRVDVRIEKMPVVLADPFSTFSSEAQIFEVAANQQINILGREGTRITIPKNALCKRNGEAVTGTVRIELKEFYTKSDIVLGNLHTMSDGRLLETGGMIYISATAKGQKLKLRPDAQMEIDFGKGATQPGMGVFLGKEQDGQVNWQLQKPLAGAKTQADGAPQRGRREGRLVETDLTEGASALKPEERKVDRFLLRTNRLGWINCDRFYLFENKSDLWVGVDKLFRPVVRLVFKDINAVMAASYANDSTVVFRQVPVGLTATLVAFSLVNGEYFFVSRELVLTNNQRENLELVKTALTAMKKELRRLD